jgi:predicted dithiol-disulfide oxidoreductase (DUF899 family)
MKSPHNRNPTMTKESNEPQSPHRVVSHEEWVRARTTHLAQEKELTRLRDELSAARRALPWEEVTKSYTFEGPRGKQTLAEIFDSASQLIVYHFMFAPDWDAGCKSCSFWADNFNGIPIHLKHRDVAFAAISRAPFPKIQAYAKRMGWSFPWYSSHGNDFNFDHYVSFTPDQQTGEAYYNYERRKVPTSDLVGISVFCKDAKGGIFHTYSTYSRGVDMMNGAYHYLDLTPKGRNESNQGPNPQAWVRRHDEYDL